MRKICTGTVRNRNKTWFTELSDKSKPYLHLKSLKLNTFMMYSEEHKDTPVLVHEELHWQC